MYDVNEKATSDEDISTLIKPPVNKIAHSFHVNTCEYKLDKLFTKQRCSSNISSDGSMEESQDKFRSNKSSLDLLYTNRIRELSKRISLLDSSIEIYDNTDVEDGLTEDEMIENHVTRLGILVKKQSAAIVDLSKEHNAYLVMEKNTRQRLQAELEYNCKQMKMFDNQLLLLQSTLDILNSKLLKRKSIVHDSSIIQTESRAWSGVSGSNEQTYPAIESATVLTKGKETKLYSYDALKRDDKIYTKFTPNNAKFTDNSPMSLLEMKEEGNDRKNIMTRKKMMTLSFGLEDDETSILV